MKYRKQLNLRGYSITKLKKDRDNSSNFKGVLDQWFLILKLAMAVGFIVFSMFLFVLFNEYHFFLGASDISSSSGGFFALMLGGSLMIASLSIMNLIFFISTSVALFPFITLIKMIKSEHSGKPGEVLLSIFDLILLIGVIILVVYNLIPLVLGIYTGILIIIGYLRFLKIIRKDILKLSLFISMVMFLCLLFLTSSVTLIIACPIIFVILADFIAWKGKTFINLPDNFLKKINLQSQTVYLWFWLMFFGLLYLVYGSLTQSVFTIFLSIFETGALACFCVLLLTDKRQVNNSINAHKKILLSIIIALAPLIIPVPGVSTSIMKVIVNDIIIFKGNNIFNNVKIDEKCYRSNLRVLQSNNFIFMPDIDGYYMRFETEKNRYTDLIDFMGTRIIARHEYDTSKEKYKVVNVVNLSKCDVVQAVKYESQTLFTDMWYKYTRISNEQHCNNYFLDNLRIQEK